MSLPIPEPESRIQRRRPNRGIDRGALPLFGLLAVGVLVGVGLMAIAGRLVPAVGEGLVQRLLAALTGRTTKIDVSQAAVVEKIRRLSRLETVEYSIDKIVVGERENLLLPNFLAGDKLLLIAHGEVIAGIDLGGLQTGDVSVKGDSVTLRLPKTQVLMARLDNDRTRVYSRDTGLLVGADPNLESQVRKAAEQQIGEAAIADGILDKARVNAQASLTALLQGLGFRTVEVR
jgi:hypothetical protein